MTRLPCQDIPEEISEQIPTSSQQEILTEVSEGPASPVSEDPVTPVSEDPVTPVTDNAGVTEEPGTPVTRRGVLVDDTPGRDADVETEFETSPEKGAGVCLRVSCLGTAAVSTPWCICG